jgi:N-acetylneuraminate synthase
MAEALSIAGHRIGPNQACFVIAEAGVNHNGDTGLALRLIDAAADAGADAVKFQTFSAERLASAVAGMADYQKRNTGQDISQLEMLKALELDEASWPDLLARCRARGIVFLSSPFDELAADLLDRIDVPAFKIPSGEITNSPYLAHIARLQRPMIVSTGMATMAEIATALDTIAAAGNPPVVLLQCYSDYPSRPEDQNLRVMASLEKAFGVPVGFSDHTEGFTVTVAAAALGACVIEKHFTLDRAMPGPDHRMSLEPGELAQMVAAVRAAQAALGDGVKQPRGSELETRSHARKSIVAAANIREGEVLTERNLAIRRPGSGLAPATLPLLIGRRARHAIAAGSLITLDSLT